MEIVSLDGSFEETLAIQNQVKKVVFAHKSTRGIVPLGPTKTSDKWKAPRSGYYAPIDVRLVVTPHLSERANVMAVVKLIDTRDLSPARILYSSKTFNLGHGIVIEGSQLPFCLPALEYPLQFEVMVLQSQFRETSTLFTTSIEWRMMSSATPLSRVRAVMGTAHIPVASIQPNFKMQLESEREVGKTKKYKVRGPQISEDG